MFSRRTSWDRTPTALAERVREVQAQGRVLRDLTRFNPTGCGLDLPMEVVLRSLANSHAQTYRAHPLGLDEARRAVSRWYDSHGIGVTPEQIVLTSGTSEAYTLLYSLLCDAGETVLVPRPGYPLCEYLADQQGIGVSPYDLLYDGLWSADWESALRAASPSTKALVVIHPHNPTGSYVADADRKRLAQSASERGIALIADEVFWSYPLTLNPPPESFASHTTELTFVLSGISKVLGLPQLKLSWIVVNGPPELREEALARLEIMVDHLLSTSMPIQGALEELLRHSQEFAGPIHDRIRSNYRWLRQRIDGSSGIDVMTSEGGWSAVLRVPRVFSDEQWALQLLDRQGVLVVPGTQFDFLQEGFLVVSLLTDSEEFHRGVEAVLFEISNITRGGSDVAQS